MQRLRETPKTTELLILIKHNLNNNKQSGIVQHTTIKAFLYTAARPDLANDWIDHSAVGVKIVQIYCTNDKETIILEFSFTIEYFIFKLACGNSKESVEMRRKKETYTHVVKSAWNQAHSKARAGKAYWNTRHDVTGSDFHYLSPYYLSPSRTII